MEWISVNKYLPANGTNVLCIQKENTTVLFAKFYDGDFQVDKQLSPGDRATVAYWASVTYWMYLPKAPTK